MYIVYVALRIETREISLVRGASYTYLCMATKKRGSKDPAAQALGRKGGKARAKNLTESELSEQGRAAVNARWERYRQAKETQAAPKTGKT
jgi:hypothetical protein